MEPDSVPVCSAVPPPCSRMTEKPARPTRAPALWSGQKASVPLYRPWLNRRHDPERHTKPGGRGTSVGGLPMPPSELQRLCQSAGGSSELTERPLLIRGESQELRYLQTPKSLRGGRGAKQSTFSPDAFTPCGWWLLRADRSYTTHGSKGPDSQGGRR